MRIETYKCDKDEEELETGWTITSSTTHDGKAQYHACDKHVAELMVHLMFIDKANWVSVERFPHS